MAETYTVGVTGAAGYIGSRVTANLLDAGHDVVPVDNFYNGVVEEVRGVGIEDLDVRDRDELADAFAGVDAIMHLAAVSGVKDCQQNQDLAFDVNVGGTENVGWLARKTETPLVFPCSMAIIGDPSEIPITADHPRKPLNHYGWTKAMSENDVEWLADGAFPAHVFMKSNLYGHHELGGTSIGKNTVINIFVEKALDGEPLTVHRPGTQARDFIHVKDVARAYLDSLDVLMATDDTGSETIPLASGDSRSILEIAETVRDVVADERGDEIDIELVDNPREGEAVSEDFDVDTDTARDRIGFEPEYDVERTVREMVAE